MACECKGASWARRHCAFWSLPIIKSPLASIFKGTRACLIVRHVIWGGAAVVALPLWRCAASARRAERRLVDGEVMSTPSRLSVFSNYRLLTKSTSTRIYKCLARPNPISNLWNLERKCAKDQAIFNGKFYSRASHGSNNLSSKVMFGLFRFRL